MTIKPLSDKVVVKKLQAEEKTASGIILSSGAQEKPQIAEIIAVGFPMRGRQDWNPYPP